MPDAHGEAKVDSKQRYIEIEVEFRKLPEATQFGAECLTICCGPSPLRATRSTWAKSFGTATAASLM
jgi:hypothetical protein